MACNWVKKGLFHLFGHPKFVQNPVWKNTSSIHLGPIFRPKIAHLQGILGFQEGQNGPPRALNAPKTLVLEVHVVEDHF